jgi:hypothetical protein
VPSSESKVIEDSGNGGSEVDIVVIEVVGDNAVMDLVTVVDVVILARAVVIAVILPQPATKELSDNITITMIRSQCFILNSLFVINLC